MDKEKMLEMADGYDRLRFQYETIARRYKESGRVELLKYFNLYSEVASRYKMIAKRWKAMCK